MGRNWYEKSSWWKGRWFSLPCFSEGTRQPCGRSDSPEACRINTCLFCWPGRWLGVTPWHCLLSPSRPTPAEGCLSLSLSAFSHFSVLGLKS